MESHTGHQRRDEPHALGDVLSHLFALRGYGRTRTGRQLADIWRSIAGERVALRTRVQGIKAGVLQIGVANSAMIQELEGFHKWSLLEGLRQHHAELGIRDIRFRLSTSIKT